MTTISITTLGCKVNQFESEALLDALEKKGYSIAPHQENAEIAIINTCTVTHRADFQSRQMVRRAYRSNPNALIIVTGCYPQVEPEPFLKMEGVRYILGNKEKRQIPPLLPLMEKGEFPRIQVGKIQDEKLFFETPLSTFHHHTRAFLKIQDGCNASCSYCIVPYARGHSRSLHPERVVENLKRLKEKGYKEVVLTGIHLGAYGFDFNPPFPLSQLLQRLEEEETPDRIRLSSIEPGDFSQELISILSKSTKICPHLHIPIQSGEDEVLKRMNRDYSRSFIFDLIQELHWKIPNLSMGTDVIVGFPGESEEKFEKTFQLIKSLPFSYLHVFPFSKKKGTLAYRLPNQIDQKEIQKRAERMRALGIQKRQTFFHQFLNQELKVLIIGHEGRGIGGWRGLSRNYIPVRLNPQEGARGLRDWMNQEVVIRVTGSIETGLIGEWGEESDG